MNDELTSDMVIGRKPRAAPSSDALVFFGATGDLAYRQIFPALQKMIQRENLHVSIIGVAKYGWTLDQFRARAHDSLANHEGDVDDDAFAKLTKQLQYIDGDYQDPATFEKLRKALDSATSSAPYLAIPPSLFASVVASLGGSGCAQKAGVIIEKPFGHALPSAQKLNAILHKAPGCIGRASQGDR